MNLLNPNVLEMGLLLIVCLAFAFFMSFDDRRQQVSLPKYVAVFLVTTPIVYAIFFLVAIFLAFLQKVAIVGSL